MRVYCKWCYILALLLFLLSGASVITNHQGVALHLMIFAFGLLIVGAALYLLDLKNENKE